MKFAIFSGLTALALFIVGFCNGLWQFSTANTVSDVPANPQARFGVGVVAHKAEDAALLERVGATWYLNWQAEPEFDSAATFWPMIRVRSDGTYTPTGNDLAEAVENSPHALWIIGNEPDVHLQDNASPLAFAIAYHDARQEILSYDENAQFAIGAVATVSALRLAYLDVTLGIYRQRYGHDMPIDVWTLHQYILPEKADGWGVGVPRGFDLTHGDIYLESQHDHIRYFRQGIVAFRWWMKTRGYQNTPLFLTEFGLLLPEFSPRQTADYLNKTVLYLLNARDENVGYAADNFQLVQGFAWYALRDPHFKTSTLVYFGSNRLTGVGQRWRELFDRANR